MARVDAAADLLVVILDRLQDLFDLGVAMARAVIVNTDADAEFLDQLVDRVESAGIDVGREVLEPEGLGKLENAAVCLGIRPHVNDAVRRQGDARFGERLLGVVPCLGSSIGTWAVYDSQ